MQVRTLKQHTVNGEPKTRGDAYDAPPGVARRLERSGHVALVKDAAPDATTDPTPTPAAPITPAASPSPAKAAEPAKKK